MLAACQNVSGLGVLLIADAGAVVTRRGDDEVERLLTRCAGALRHNIKQLSVGLAEKLIENTAVDVVAILAGHIRGKRLIDTASRHIHQPLLRFDDLDALHQQLGLQHHVLGNIENNAGLRTVIGATVDFRAFLIVGTEHIQRDSSSQFTVVRGQKRTPHQILVRRTVYLNALHARVPNGFDFGNVSEMAARLRPAPNCPFLLTGQSGDGPVIKSREFHIIHCLTGGNPPAFPTWL